MAISYRARVWVPVAAGIIFFLCGPAQTGASQTKINDRNFADIESRAEQGYAEQQFELGHAYFYGLGVKQDFQKAALWYEKAAKSGSPEAENQIGFLYQNGMGVGVDLQRAVHWYQLSSASGLALGKVNLAVCYLHGIGVPKNNSTARQLLIEAVEKGEGEAAAYLGRMELTGVDGPQNLQEAERWFKAGTRLKDAVSAYDLAYLYTAVDGHSRDLEKGTALLRFSAHKGYVPALHSLGLLLVNHPEIKQGDSEARTLLQRASSAGYWRASAVLGILARDGRGTPADPAAAFYYFRLAVLQGGAKGEQAVAADLRALSNRLPRETTSAWASRASAWFEQHHDHMQFVLNPENGEMLSVSGPQDDAAM